MMAVIDSLLAPLARLAVRRGVLFAQLAEQLKAHLVRAAQGEGATTDSRISVATGLQRRDIARLKAAELPARPPVNHLSRLVALWLADDAYAGCDLPRQGPAPSFEVLALTIRRDVHPRTLLDQLVAAGTVRITPDDLVILQAQGYQPLSGSDAQLDYFARNAGDFLAAATANVLTDPAPFFERAVHYNQLDDTAIATLEAQYRKAQMQVLQDLNRAAAVLKSSNPGTRRFRAGGYFYHEDET